MIIPPIKCQGKKTKLVEWIASKIPVSYNVWYEPFMGSGVVGFNIMPKKAVFSDTNPHIIQFYKDIQSGTLSNTSVKEYLLEHTNKLAMSGVEYYKEVRNRFNLLPNSHDFLFLNRSCFNGLMRFNKNGGFNVPFCHKPNRFSRSYITKIVNQIEAVAKIIKKNDYEFRCVSFEEIIVETTENDFIYCDPPYIDRYADYHESWNEEKENLLSLLLNSTKSKFLLSTWHHNKYRKNNYIEMNYKNFYIDTKEHFYHVGANEINRNSMLECLINNYDIEQEYLQETNSVDDENINSSNIQISMFD
ncbi:MAG: Dam family site-specific DNA-(adenine-N6)-methyltransferase [Defluviitaleaceae bacterium]|nr:Dam family site-specific DNA-(adenine-N6)-methyltransferase [Defluviitaleaceae bacterium]